MTTLLKQRGLIFNIILFLYLFFIQPHLLGLIHATENLGQPQYTLGLLMIAVSILDLAGYYLKSPSVFCRILKVQHKVDISFPVFMLWIGHTVLGIALVMITLHAFNVKNETAQFFAFGFAVIKELAVLGLMWRGSDTRILSVQPIRETLGDLFILTFAAIAFSSTWTFITAVQGAHIADKSIASTIVNIIPATILFLFFFLPARMIYLIEEWYTVRTDMGKLSIIGTILMNVIAALWLAW